MNMLCLDRMYEKHRNALVLTITIVLICKGNVYGESIARNKPVTMSSQFGTWLGSYVVDGNYSTSYDACQCCAATETGTNPWIQIDLGREENFTRIVVYGRTDTETLSGQIESLSGLRVQKLTSENNAEDIALIPTSDTFIKLYEFHIGKALTARYIRFVLVGENRLLVLCEVDVFNECTNGTYGNNCLEECGSCTHHEICDKVNGDCRYCMAGYNETDLTCKTECTHGTYGRNCLEECGNCANHETCDNVNGDCRYCMAGYNETDLTCKTVCEDGYYGDCETRCGNCKGPDICNKTTGECHQGCESGYNYPMCTTECQTGTFDFNCEHRCGMCKNEDICDIYTGECPNGCAGGYNGDTCVQEMYHYTSSSSDTSISLPVFIGSLFASIVFLAAIVIVVALVFRRQKEHRKTHKVATSGHTSIPLPSVPSNYDTLKFDSPGEESTYTELNGGL